MKINFTEGGSFMMFAMLKNPHLLQQGTQQYKAPDQLAAFQVIRLIKFTEKNLTEKLEDGNRVKFKTGEFNLEASLVQRMKDIAKHFEQVGLLAGNCEAYLEFTYALEGKKIDSEIPDAVIPE